MIPIAPILLICYLCAWSNQTTRSAVLFSATTLSQKRAILTSCIPPFLPCLALGFDSDTVNLKYRSASTRGPVSAPCTRYSSLAAEEEGGRIPVASHLLTVTLPRRSRYYFPGPWRASYGSCSLCGNFTKGFPSFAFPPSRKQLLPPTPSPVRYRLPICFPISCLRSLFQPFTNLISSTHFDSPPLHFPRDTAKTIAPRERLHLATLAPLKILSRPDIPRRTSFAASTKRSTCLQSAPFQQANLLRRSGHTKKTKRGPCSQSSSPLDNQTYPRL